jgi:nicotinate-nucleotide adenylyltransferase
VTRAGIRQALPARGRRIGLLGGSFNPAHEGHLHISRYAIKMLGLDAVWWLVSPQNPLKPDAGMAAQETRMRTAIDFVCDRRITVTDIESRLGTRYTIDTIDALLENFPDKRFVWIMGADNLIQFPQWKDWRRLFASVPIAVFDRAPYSTRALAGYTASVFASSRRANRNARKLADCKPPAWTFFHTPLHPASASDIRAKQSRLGQDAL